MKLTLERIKQLIKEELNNSIDESINSKIFEMLESIKNWGEENGHWQVKTAVGPWLSLVYSSDRGKQYFEKQAKEMGKTPEELKQALIDMSPDYKGLTYETNS